ncbi:MAG: cytochrome b/b6 domain-containing protein [Gemmatimonadota bacterium]
MTSSTPAAPEHRAAVRITHWVNTLSFVALVISGVAILMAHPRLYWGDVGNDEMAAAIELPLALNLKHSGWGRSLHFLGAWVTLLNGIVYVGSGLVLGHFRKRLGVTSAGRAVDSSYDLPQKLVYLTVVFVLLPAIILTGLTMSPAVTAAVPTLTALFGGRQSARTLHFFLAVAMVLFLAVHLIQVTRAGFGSQVRAMTLGAKRR